VSGADGAVLFRLSPGERVIRAVTRAGQVSQELVDQLELPVGQGASGLAVAGGRPVWTANVARPGGPCPGAGRTRMMREGVKAVIAIPLQGQGGEMLGTVSVLYRSAREFDDADVERLSAFGTQASVAIEHGRSFDQLALKGQRDE